MLRKEAAKRSGSHGYEKGHGCMLSDKNVAATVVWLWVKYAADASGALHVDMAAHF